MPLERVSRIALREQWRAPRTDSDCRSRQQSKGMKQCITVVLDSPWSISAAEWAKTRLIENTDFSAFLSSSR